MKLSLISERLDDARTHLSAGDPNTADRLLTNLYMQVDRAAVLQADQAKAVARLLDCVLDCELQEVPQQLARLRNALREMGVL